ncbi:MAG TPA: pyridoxamine 5'-phosphate oxidase [Chitinophagaceae bacterium]|nr:pyridoxamine 5'-phosphate oxidase [Chitinophagaceae bacterium]MCB9054781.1 pyridoxamine 5'-phosphate oxidase [Chitinophagales bacterium]HPG09984.1 pyridoxamine 5'-phosphate oxidase [Chitinophagaceae bacterium]HRX92682.1 pyridoxamine 5'-phosphate oxidase [Chitinophagaceae bacterium]
MKANISAIRKTYSKRKLLEINAPADPLVLFEKWWKQALAAEVEELNAMTLATASADGTPSARIVLLKDVSKRGFTFFSNYDSYKGMQLAENPKACLVIFWRHLERQIRITGIVEKLDDASNDEYFHSRPFASQVGALASFQSRVIKNRKSLDKRFNRLKKQLKGKEVPRPSSWGGYLVKPVIIEFWQGRPGRLHDRLQYTLKENGKWKRERLSP